MMYPRLLIVHDKAL